MHDVLVPILHVHHRRATFLIHRGESERPVRVLHHRHASRILARENGGAAHRPQGPSGIHRRHRRILGVVGHDVVVGRELRIRIGVDLGERALAVVDCGILVRHVEARLDRFPLRQLQHEQPPSVGRDKPLRPAIWLLRVDPVDRVPAAFLCPGDTDALDPASDVLCGLGCVGRVARGEAQGRRLEPAQPRRLIGCLHRIRLDLCRLLGEFREFSFLAGQRVHLRVGRARVLNRLDQG